MNVCDDKITKLKERIKSELPVYSSEQINRSREVTLECVMAPTFVKNPLQDSVFNSPLKEGELRRVFKDQTERAILQSKQSNNRPKPLGAGGKQKKSKSALQERKSTIMKQKDGNSNIENQNLKMRENKVGGDKKEEMTSDKAQKPKIGVLENKKEEFCKNNKISDKVYKILKLN